MAVRADFEAILVNRFGATLIQVGKDGITKDGTNVDLGPPLGTTLNLLGFFPSSLVDPVDADFAVLPADRVTEFEMRSGLASLEMMLWAATDVNEKAGTQSQSLSQLPNRIQARIDSLSKQIIDRYGVADQSIVYGDMTSGVDLGAGGLMPWIPPDPCYLPIG